VAERLVLVAAVVVTFQCRPIRATSADGGTPPRATPSSSSAVIDASSVPAHARPTAREIVDAWNLAHTKHDLKALESLYAPWVVFYGQTLTNQQCVQKKRAAFEKTPDYAQSIRDVVVSEGGVVTFTKTSTSGGKSADYPAVLVVTGGLVSGETDKITEANLEAQASRARMWCVDDSWLPTDKVIPPYRVSALRAYQKARETKHFKAVEASEHGDFLDFGQVWCPTGCDRAARKCGYDMRLENHAAHVSDNPEPHSNLVEWMYVDAVDGTLWFQEVDGWKSEPLPP
jgi:hypothetical protein